MDKSKGHIVFTNDGRELFCTIEDGQQIICAAPSANPISTYGYRMGARFECYDWALPPLLKLLAIDDQR